MLEHTSRLVVALKHGQQLLVDVELRQVSVVPGIARWKGPQPKVAVASYRRSKHDVHVEAVCGATRFDRRLGYA